MVNYTRHPASFKDPAGYVFETGGKVYRQVNQIYAAQYNHLVDSGLYRQLADSRQLISHETINKNLTGDPEWHLTLLPEQLQFISYPYEWCFEQLKDAALLTLSILRTSIQHGMILKDATPFNIQFHKDRPVFIDTLSFDVYDPQQPWIAYRQFCQCFLFPLYLEHYLKADIQKILSTYPDGIPIEIISKMLPLKSRLSLGVWLHVYLQNTNYISEKENKATTRFSRKKLLDIITHLENIISRFPSGRPLKTTWSNYYDDTILSREYLQEKENIIRSLCSNMEVRTALDLGANDGYFSRLLAETNVEVVATDTDSRCISKLYQEVKEKSIPNILPLVLDVANPSPAIGFHNRERAAFHARIQTDLVLALALVHHLVIGKNISLPFLAAYFQNIAPQLIIEFVPKEDPKVVQMLASRPDTFPGYTEQDFEAAFLPYFKVISRQEIPGTRRALYYMKRKTT